MMMMMWLSIRLLQFFTSFSLFCIKNPTILFVIPSKSPDDKINQHLRFYSQFRPFSFAVIFCRLQTKPGPILPSCRRGEAWHGVWTTRLAEFVPRAEAVGRRRCLSVCSVSYEAEKWISKIFLY